MSTPHRSGSTFILVAFWSADQGPTFNSLACAQLFAVLLLSVPMAVVARPVSAQEKTQFDREPIYNLPADPPANAPVKHFSIFPLNVDQRVHGVQLGGWNVAGELYGLQLSYACFALAGELHGVQLSLTAAMTRRVKGLQIAFLTTARERGAGVQIGVVNVAKSYQGLQIGVVNLIEDGGFPLGLINYWPKGRLSIEGVLLHNQFVYAQARSGSSWYHYSYAYGRRLNSDRTLLALGPGLRLDLWRVSLNLDVRALRIAGSGDGEGDQPPEANRWGGEGLVDFAVHLTEYLHLFGTASFKIANNDDQTAGDELGFRVTNLSDSWAMGMSVGGGLRLRLRPPGGT